MALERILLTGDRGAASAMALLWLTEVDESGRLTAGVAFDVDDWRAATREAFARWFARDAVAAASVGPVLELSETINEHDRTRLRAALADNFVFADHRPARLGLIEGADALAESFAALWDLAPEVQIAPGSALAHARYGSVGLGRTFGTLRDGGAFETPIVSVSVVADARITRLELFELEHVDAALARFAELRPDPLRVPPNAAKRASDRAQEAFHARDWDAFGASCAPALVFDDRRRFVLLPGDREMFMAAARWFASEGFRRSPTLLATAGDRLILEHVRWLAGAPDAQDAHIIETLDLTEVDAEGRLVAYIDFDPDDRRAASAELFERYARSDAARCIPAAAFEELRATNAHDLDRLRAALPHGFVLHDHRRTSIGRLESADAYLASLAALFEQSPDLTFEILYIVAAEKHGCLAIGRHFGTLAKGSGEFESLYVRLSLYQRDRYVGLELFELEDLDVARARFEELRPDPLRMPPNGA